MADELIEGATDPNYILQLEDVGRQIYCRVTATNAVGQDAANALAVGPITAGVAPISTSAPLIADAAPETTEVLHCTTGGWASSGSPTFNYQWKRGVTNVGTDSANYTVVDADIGAMLSCVVTATNSFGNTPATSNEVGPAILGTAPVNTVQPSVTADESPAVGETVHCGPGTWTGSTVIIYTYQWMHYPDLDPIFGATSQNYTLQPTDAGTFTFCRVTATNGIGSAFAYCITLGPIAGTGPIPINITVPAIADTMPGVPETITCTTGTWINTPTSYGYQWFNSVSGAISGATSNSYTLVSTDIGDTIYCRVTAINAFGSTTVTSNVVGPVGEIPVITTAPSIADITPTIGETLTCAPGVWTGTATITFSYQWYHWVADVGGLPTGTPIAGATSDTYVIGAEGVPVNIVVPEIADVTPEAGETLTCANGEWEGAAPIVLTKQWCRAYTAGDGSVYVDADGNPIGEAIPGATGNTYAVS